MNRCIPVAALVLVVVVGLSASRWVRGLSDTVSEDEVIQVLNRYHDEDCLSDPEVWLRGEFPVDDAAAKEGWEDALKQLFPTTFQRAEKMLRERYGLAISRIQINEPFRADCVNIYVVRRDPHRLLPRLGITENAASLGFGNIIVCDEAMIRAILDRPSTEERAGPFLAPIGWYHKRVLILFVLLHEIGHVAHGHSERNYFDTGPVAWDDGGSVGRAFAKETEADHFGLEVLREHTDDSDVGTFTPHFLMVALHDQLDAISAEVFESGIDDLIKSDRRLQLRTRSTTHPPMFVRFALMSQQIRERGKDFSLSGDYWDYSPVLQRMTVQSNSP